MKSKNLLFLSIFFGLFINSLFQYPLVLSFQYQIGIEDFNIKSSSLQNSWKILIDCIPMEMTIDSENNIYVVGGDESWDRSLKLLKYDTTGTELWIMHFTDLFVYDPHLKTDSLDNLYLVCTFRNETSQSSKALVKFNSSGDLQWQQIFTSDYVNYVSDFAIDSEDIVYMYCEWDSEDYQNHSIFIMKFNSSGNQIDYNLLEESNSFISAGGIKIDSENNFIISGSFYDEHYKYWIKSYNELGILKWYTESGFETYPLFALDSSDNIITIRETWDNISYDRNLELIKYDTSGNSLWKHIINSKYTDHFYYPGIPVPMIYQFALTADNSDSIYIAWDVEIPNDSYRPDILMIKVNETGKFERYLTWGGQSDDSILKLDADSYNNIYLCSNHFLVKNPISNGKTFFRTNLWYFFLSLFGIFCFISLITLYFMIKPRIKNRSNLV